MTTDLSGSLFELQDNRLKLLGDPLLELEEAVNWNGFRKVLNRVNQKECKSNMGAKSKDVLIMGNVDK